MKKIVIVLLIIGFAIVNSNAQINTKTFEKNKAFDIHPEFKISQITSPVFRMPNFDVAKMLAEDEAVKGLPVPFRFGKGFDVNYTLKDGNWEKTNNGRIWSILFQSEGAYSINFIFNELFLPEGGELYIYNLDGTMVYGPVTSKQNLIKGKFLTDLIQGDAVTIHIFEPEKAKNKTHLTISRVVHAYVNIYDNSPLGLKSATLTCHNNIDCYPNWEDESDGVALILLSDGTEWCSGGLINNTGNDYTPYILTAFHCLDGNETSWMFKFGFRENDCGGMNYISTTYNESALISSWDDSDFALLEMNVSPLGNGNITFLGWDNRNNTPTSGTCIHHPGGDYMKISFDNNSLTTNNQILYWSGGSPSPVSTHWDVGFDNGTTENGSSGSPLFDQNNRVVGQLHGGDTGCPPVTKYFGRFDVSWDGGGTNATQLAHWLDPNDTGNPTTNLLRSPSLSVPDVICYSGTTVSMQDPPGATITWGGENVSYPNGNTGTSVTVRAASSSTSDEGTVTASFTVNGIQRTIIHPVWVGKPDPADFYVAAVDNYGSPIGPSNGPFQVCPNNYYTFYLYPSYNLSENHHRYGITDIDFFFDFDYQIVYGGYGWAYIYVDYIDDNSYGLVYVDSECGGYDEFKVVNANEGYCGYLLSFTPNPTTNETTLAIESASREKTFDETAQWDLEVYSEQLLKTKQTGLRGQSAKIQTAGWKEGVYLVRVNYNNEVLTGKLVVKR